MNHIIISGNVCAKPEIRLTKDETKVANFQVAVRGNKEHTDFIRCVAFGKTAEYLENNCDKGMRIMVEGSLHTDSYVNKDGVKVNTFDVNVRNVELTFKNATPKADEAVELDDEEELPFN